MAAPRTTQALPEQPRPDRPLRENRVVQWFLERPRLLFGLALILVAVIALVVTNLQGLSTEPDAPAVVAPSHLPSIGSTVATRYSESTAKYAGRLYQAGGKDVPSGERYLAFAVRMRNSGTHALSVQIANFSVRSGHVLYGAVAYPGHSSVLFAQSLQPGAQADAYFLVVVPDHSLSGALLYTPSSRTGDSSISWGFAAL